MSSSHGPSITHQDSLGGESDSLEYYIKFPAATSTNQYQQGNDPNMTSSSGTGPVAVSGNNGQAESDYVFVVNGETSNIPIVLLLGWAGCQDKYLMKYSQIYEERG